MSKIEDCVAGVAEFNVLAGNLEDITHETLLSQVRVVREEGNELYDAVFYEEGQEQVLKEAVDVLVTIHGFVGMLQNLGYDVYGAWKEVNDNNTSKFPSDYTSAKYSAFEYESAGTSVIIIPVSGGRYAIKDFAGKIRKPFGYEKPDLKKYLPQQKEE